ncbi:MAG: alpha/beta hydrolase [Pirellulales bacterium]|nr:alpha/beta hydrolase [Pirellulales bacterium]
MSQHSPRMPKLTKRSLLLKWLPTVVVLGVLAWLGSSGVVAWNMTRRARPPFEEPAPAVDWGTLEPHRLLTSDGQQIGAWLIRGEASRGCVLLLHGNGKSRRSMLPLMQLLAGRELGVMAISLRAHGDSTGSTNDFGYSARLDVLAAVEFLEAECPGRPIFLAGRSLGAAAAVFAAETLGHRVAGYFLESPYKDLQSATRNRLAIYLPPMLDDVASAGLRLWSGAFLPVAAAEIAPSNHASSIPRDVPVVVLAGEKDRRATPADVRAVFRQVQSHGAYVAFPGATHGDLYRSDPERYHRALLELVSP